MEGIQINKFLGNESLSMVEAMQKIDINAKGILFIVTEDNVLVGTVTDGDIRRAIIKTGNLDLCVRDIMNYTPQSVRQGEQKNAYTLLEQLQLNAIPVIDSDGILQDIIFRESVSSVSKEKENILQGVPIVIMAGGKGTRLYPYTKILPKPLIPMGDIPIVERIMERFNSYGSEIFYMTVNYRKNMIKSYLAEQTNYNITFIEEEKPLGTAGSLKMLSGKVKHPFFVTNCDILINADYGEIYRYHIKTKNAVTIISALKSIEVPYGVIQSNGNGNVSALEEKPHLSYFINTGMYVLDPEYIEYIPENMFFHMTDLLEMLLNKRIQVGMYPISEESFLDMGEWEELQRMEQKLKKTSD